MKKIICEHKLDKNNKYCVRCGCKVISWTFSPTTPKEQKEWLEKSKVAKNKN